MLLIYIYPVSEHLCCRLQDLKGRLREKQKKEYSINSWKKKRKTAHLTNAALDSITKMVGLPLEDLPEVLLEHRGVVEASLETL